MKDINYRIGLDVGIASVGWAVINLDKQRIEDLGVRIFEAAEHPKDGSSLALPRRLARSRRRLLRRKAYRIKRVKKLISDFGILSKEEIDNLYNEYEDIWSLRVKALNQRVTAKEWAKILINLCKRRGFKSNRKNEAKDKEAGKLISSIKINENRMLDLNAKTVAEYMYKLKEQTADKYMPIRNKNGTYNMCVSRMMIENEIKILFESQRNLGSEFANEKIEKEYLNIFNAQRPYSKFEDLEKMIGYCTFEKDNKELRAPKNCISVEEFILYDNMNKLSIINNGNKRNLTKEERNTIIENAYKKNEIKYKDLRKILSLDDNDRFSGLTYSNKTDISKTENSKFVSMKGYHEIKKSIEKNLGKEKWNNIKNDRKLLNDLAYVLTIAKTDEDIIKQLKIRNVDEDIINAVIEISFTKFNNLSIKAIEKILPYLKEGYQYNEACDKAGYDFKAVFKGEKELKLPLINAEEIINPVVIRSLTQTRKVVNAIIDKYGSPRGINIELARDLAKSFKDRKNIEKQQKENRDNKEKIRNELKELMRKEPTGSEVLKYRLWKEQKEECAYSQEHIYIDDLFKPGLYEIDHIIPFSRCFDDSLSNKVLVKGVENQNKKNRIPYEYFGSDTDRWHKFEVWVEQSSLGLKKKTNLLKKKVSEEEQKAFKSRNLNDTRYISKYIANYIDNRLIFKEDNVKRNTKKVITINGGATSFLRAKWGLIKVRENGDKHHALDAAVIAVTTQKMVNEISKYSKANELKNIKCNEEYIDIETGEVIDENIIKQNKVLLKDVLPRPWRGFSQELKLRLSDNPKEELKKLSFDSYDNEFIENTVRPVFVSRVPNRKASGMLFKETIYSANAFKNNKSIVKKNLCDLKLSDMDNVYNYSSDKKLYDSIKEQLVKYDGNAKKAFENGFRKPTKSGKLGPVVKSIKIVTNLIAKDMVDLNKGKVQKDGIVRVDIYKKDKKYYSVPVYRVDIAKGVIPKKAAVNHKPESEWTEIDENYEFQFSVYKNDLIEIKRENEESIFGYFNNFDRDSARYVIKSHDNSLEQKIAIKKGVKELNKYEVNVLGEYYKVKGGK
ncbi:MAG: type II CRISPR RNA-guided endonuclease Cas9 [Clostridium butyricum]|nr:type II CRISPR RNA-guided endonuclease Cas9 [Clostridium butyricum]